MTAIDDFPKISDHFLKILEDFPKLFQRKDKHFRTFFGHFPKITKDFWGGTDDVSIIQKHIQVLFKGLCNHSKGDHFSSYGNTNILTCER